MRGNFYSEMKLLKHLESKILYKYIDGIKPTLFIISVLELGKV